MLPVDGGETAGTVGTDGAELPTPAVVGDTLVVGTADGGLTPRLPISLDPNGTPVRVLPVAVVDDDLNKHGSRLHGVPVVGSVAQLTSIVEKHSADEIVIAIPSATADQIGRVVDACVQLHGGYGFMADYPIARAWVDARAQRIYGGTNEIMKDLIGRSL